MALSDAKPKHWPDGWSRLREALLNPRVDPEKLEEALREARVRQPLPVVWLIGKTQAGKTSIIRALTGSAAAGIGNGFQPCTRTARFYDFPTEAPVVRFLDTRGLGEVAYDPAEDIHYCESQAHLALGVMKVADLQQDAVFEALRQVRKRHPEWPVLIVQTGLHEVYPPDAHHILPYPYDQQPWSLQISHDLRRALQAQRDRLGNLPGSAPVRAVSGAAAVAVAAKSNVLELREESTAFKRDYEERAKEFEDEAEMEELFSDDAQNEAEAAKAEAKKVENDRRAKAIMQGYTGNSCPECQNFTMVRNGTCEKCDTCGSTSGCS